MKHTTGGDTADRTRSRRRRAGGRRNKKLRNVGTFATDTRKA